MSKIICDICGTSYQDTAECCPICGCARDAAADILAEDLLAEEVLEQPKTKAEKASSKKKPIFDYDEVNTLLAEEDMQSEEEAEEFEDDEDEDDQPRRNVFVVILLTILIVALLLAAGFIFVKYFLPNMGDEEETVPATTQEVVQESEATELRIPCETLILNSTAKAELTEVGFSHLINVMPSPKDTTDQLTFVSADQSVATVSEDGKITAVGEGETIVTISCGDVQMFVNVTCVFTPETEPVEQETTEATAEGENTDNSGDAATGETKAEEEDQKEIDSNVTLKLKKSDITLGVYYQFRLELDCDLDPADVEWSSEHPHIASVDEEGVVTAVKSGTTAIIAKYGNQQVQCLIRCV